VVQDVLQDRGILNCIIPIFPYNRGDNQKAEIKSAGKITTKLDITTKTFGLEKSVKNHFKIR
jgi:hypothetical protein